MNGLRLSNIQPGLSQDLISYYLDTSGIVVKKLYFPLFNNEAVVLLQDQSDTARALCEQLDNLTRFTVSPLPHKIFSKVTVELEPEATTLFISTAECEKKIEDVTQGRVEISRGVNGSIKLSGSRFDIELAENVLHEAMERQYAIAQHMINGHEESLAGSMTRSYRDREQGRLSARDRDPSSKKTVADRIHTSSRGGNSVQVEADAENLSNGFDFQAGAGFSFSRLSSIDDQTGRVQRELDASRTFSDFASLSRDDQTEVKKPVVKPRTILTQSPGREAGKLEDELGRNELPGTEGRSDLGSLEGAVGGAGISYPTRKDRSDNMETVDGLLRSEGLHQDAIRDQERNRAHNDKRYDHLMKRSDDTSKADRNPYSSLSNHKDLYKSSHAGHSLIEDVKQPVEYSGKNMTTMADTVTKFNFDLPGGIKVKVFCGNIVQSKTHGIVNAANGDLMHISGVAGALEKACGSEMKRECEKYIQQNGRLEVSHVMHTTAGNLRSSLYILHTVGPIYAESLKVKCGNLLTRTFLRCLDYARRKLFIQSIAFPFISTGIFGAPLDMCIEAFLDALLLFSTSHQSDAGIREIHLINNDLEMVQTAIVMLQQHLDQEMDMLVAKAMSRLQSPDGDDSSLTRSPRTETKGGAIRRTSSLSRISKSTVDHDSDLRFRNSDTGSLKHDGGSQHKGKEPTISRHRSGSFDSRKGSSRERPSSAELGVSGSGKKTSSGLSSVLMSKTMPGIRSEMSTFGVKDKLRNRPGGSSNGSNSPRNKPMKATGSLMKSEADAYIKDRSDQVRWTFDHEEKYHSLPVSYGRSGSPRGEADDNFCPICMDKILFPKKLGKCDHVFCRHCIDEALRMKPVCPVCGKLYGVLKGDQPPGGSMDYTINRDLTLPGHRDARGVIIIEYKFPNGVQQAIHPNPGRRYSGLRRTAYLPNNKEGFEVLKLLQKAFDAGLTFTIGDSRTTGQSGVITWNDIHHKTEISGGSSNFGYPDPDYLKRVKEELAAKGLTS